MTRSTTEMTTRSWLTAIWFALLASQASAQIADPDQRMRWFNLQRLATETEELNNCWLADPERYKAAYYKAATETGAAVQAYIEKYPETFKDESADAFRYRVWSVALGVGKEKARSPQQLKSEFCALLIR